MIRILQMIGSLEMGGSQSMIMNIYRNIQHKEIQFDFILDNPTDLYFKKEILSLGGKIFIFSKFNGRNYFEVRNTWDNFFKEHNEYKILHSHVRSYASIYLPIAKKHGLKTIAHSHSTSNGSGLTSIGKMILQYPLRFQADYFFGCSKESGEWLFGKKVVAGNKYYILENGIDLEKFIGSKSRDRTRRELKISNEEVFIHVGRLHESKNHLFLLEVFKNLINKNNNRKLVLVGDGPLKGKIEETIQKFELDKFVIMVGAKNNVCDYFDASDCFLFPSSWEGLPVTVIEAQAAGLPCFISDRITDDVNITPLVHKLSIDNGVDVWIDEIEKSSLKKIYYKEEIKKSGFDINTSSKKLIEFYKRIINE